MKRILTLFILVVLVGTSLCAQSELVKELHINGLNKTRISFIKNRLKTKIEQPLDSTLIENDLIRLKRLPSISNATYEVNQLENKGYKIQFYLEENHTLIPDINYWTTINTTAYKVGVYEYNLFGKNMTLGGFYQFNGHHTFALNFNAPYLISNKFGLGFNFLNWNSEEPLYFENESVNFIYQNRSYEVVGSYELNFKNTVQVGLSFFNEKYVNQSAATVPDIPNQLDVNKQLVKFIYTHQNLDYFYFYISGFKSLFNGQLVTSKIKSQNDFLIAWNDFLYYKRIGLHGNWAQRLRLGLSTNNDSPFAAFALDNNLNLRGVGNVVDRGTGSIVLNSEYRYTIFEKKSFVLQGNGFIDAGTWRKPGKSLKNFADTENIKIYTGLGIRMIHTKIFNAVFRIDYGYGLTKNSNQGFVFGIGQYF